jgi:3-oxoacyl-[acyl-carrier-protein] synthase-3
MILPCSAALVQKNINAVNAWGYDLSAACSGFLFGLESGAALIVSGRCKKVIVIGADTMSSILNYEDRNTCILFGDGAGAVLLEPSEEFGIIDSELRIDGTGGEFLRVDGGGSLHPASHETVSNKLHYVRQDGKTVYKFAVRGMADISYEVAERNNLKGDDISLFIPHQANKRIIDAAAKRLGLKESQVMINIDTYANTTSATIPICIAEVSEKNMLNIGDNVIISTFGAGFSWGAMYLKWGMQANA